jgi:hypothetical protein
MTKTAAKLRTQKITSSDYEALIIQAREFVPPTIRVDMYRHESVTDWTFWPFDEKEQIGCAVRETRHSMPWRGTRMNRDMPYAEQRFISMDKALQFAASRK